MTKLGISLFNMLYALDFISEYDSSSTDMYLSWQTEQLSIGWDAYARDNGAICEVVCIMYSESRDDGNSPKMTEISHAAILSGWCVPEFKTIKLDKTYVDL